MRAFVAAELPAAVRRELAGRIDSLRRELPPARWVRAEGIHLTLAFLGEIAPDRVAPLGVALAAELGPLAPFAASVGGLGAFPAHGAIRVVWAGIEPEAPFGLLAEAARRAVSACALPFDDKTFRPHLTLARCPRPWPAPARAALAQGLERWPEIAFEVDAVAVVESTLGPGGSTYATRATTRLGAAA